MISTWRVAQRLTTATIVLLFTFTILPDTVQASEIRVIASAGDMAPGTLRTFTSLNAPVLNASGEVAFYGDTSNAIGSDGIWKYNSDSSLSPVAVVGGTAPGMGTGATFEAFLNSGNGGNNRTSTLTLTDSGWTAFAAETSDGRGFWARRPNGVMDLIVKNGDSAIGTPHLFARVADRIPAINESGDVVFRSSTDAGGIRNGAAHHYSASTQSLSYIAAANTPIVGDPQGQSFDQPAFSGPVIDAEGNAYFNTSLEPSSLAASGIGTWSPGGTARIVHRSGDPTPGISQGNLDTLFQFEPAANSAGEVAFTWSFTEASSTTIQTGIWSGDPINPDLVARTGGEAPGMPDGVEFSQLTSPEINAQGRVAFRARVTGPGINFGNDEGLWLQDEFGNLKLVAQEGDLPPGAPAGVVFENDFGNSFAFNDIALNDVGQIAFRGSYSGLEVPTNLNETGVWATDRDGELQLIAMAGVSFETDRGTRNHGALRFAGGSGGDEGFGVGINNQGQVAFSGNFFSTTSVYLSYRVVPEPSGNLLMIGLMPAVVFSYLRKKRRSWAC